MDNNIIQQMNVNSHCNNKTLRQQENKTRTNQTIGNTDNDNDTALNTKQNKTTQHNINPFLHPFIYENIRQLSHQPKDQHSTAKKKQNNVGLVTWKGLVIETGRLSKVPYRFFL